MCSLLGAGAEGYRCLTGNLWIQTTVSDFESGTNQGTVITREGDGEVRLAEENGVFISGGVYTSEAIKTPAFEYLVLSWNADTPKGTSIKLEGQARINNQWSSWLSWGIWSSTSERASFRRKDAEDELAYVSTDTLTVKGSSGESANAFRYRVTLLTEDPKATPVLRLVAATIRNSIEGQRIEKVYNEAVSEVELRNLNKIIDVPVYSQIIRDPEMAHKICSAVSIAMLLKYKGVDILPEQSAMGVYDSVYDGYGNWSFSTAYGGCYGYASYVEYMNSIEDLKREIIMGYPAAVSVRYRNSEDVDKPYPVIHAAPIKYTAGHLLVVCGFTKGQDGRDYAVVNDPAAASDEGVRLLYLAEELDRAWAASGRTAYIMHDKIPGDGAMTPIIQEAETRSTGRTRELEGKTYVEYELYCSGELIDLSMAVDPCEPNYEKGISIMLSKGDGTYEYITPREDKTLWLDTARPVGKKDIFIFKKTGDSYKV